jgi:hypothetical protein
MRRRSLLAMFLVLMLAGSAPGLTSAMQDTLRPSLVEMYGPGTWWTVVPSSGRAVRL